jgi:thiamine-phosphate pyrophosphorylase
MDSSGRGLDANGNRAAEGVRVLEDVARFVLNDAGLAAKAKDLRHRIRAAIPAFVVSERDTPADVGVELSAQDPMRRETLVDVIRANAKRTQEALRSAEEFAKLGFAPSAAALQQSRYDSYELETRLLARLPAWQLWRVKLYAIVDTNLTGRPIEVAAAVAKGGAGAVQLRAKAMPVADYRDLAGRMRDVCRMHGALFVVNDHVEVARMLGADGVHVGQKDFSVSDARAVVGPLCAIGSSTHSAEQVAAACAAGADYLGIGPIYTTATKPHEPVQGPDLLDAARAKLSRPSFAIGGLNSDRIRELGRRIPHGVAVAGALCTAPDPQRAAAEIAELFDEDPT